MKERLKSKNINIPISALLKGLVIDYNSNTNQPSQTINLNEIFPMKTLLDKDKEKK